MCMCMYPCMCVCMYVSYVRLDYVRLCLVQNTFVCAHVCVPVVMRVS